MYDYDELNEKDKEFVDGFKWCVEQAVDLFFDNMFDYSDDYLTHVLNEKVPEHMQEEYEMEYSFGNRAIEKRKIVTYGDLLRMRMLEYLSVEMSELMISILDNYEEEDNAGQGKTED